MERSADDIINLFSLADEHSLRQQFPTFCAASLARVPMIPAEMSDPTCIRYELNTMRKQVELLISKLESVTLPAWKATAYNGHSEQQASSTYIQDFPSLPKQSGTQERNVQQTLPGVQHGKTYTLFIRGNLATS